MIDIRPQSNFTPLKELDEQPERLGLLAERCLLYTSRCV